MYTQPIVELQISAPAFLAAQLLGLQFKKLSFPPPFLVGDLQIVVDHIEFGENSLRHNVSKEKFIYYKESLSDVFERVSGLVVQVIQPITVFVVELSDILNHPNQPPANLIPISASMVFNLGYGLHSDGNDRLESFVDHVEIGPLPLLPPGIDGPALEQQFRSFVSTLTVGTTTILGLASQVIQVGRNVDLSVDSDLTRLAFRLEQGSGIDLDVDIWRDFYLGSVPDRLKGADWGIFQSKVILETAAQVRIEQGLNANQTGKFQLLSGVGATYSNGAGTANVTSRFLGNVDAGICTVETDVEVTSVLSVTAANALTIDTEISWQTETTACTVTAAILGGILGLAADFVAPLGSFIVDPILGALSGVAAVVYLDNTLIPPLPAQDCTQVSDTHLTCTQNLSVVSTPLGSLSFNTLLALDDGISLQGQLKAIPAGGSQLVITINGPFQWSTILTSGCGSGKQGVKDFLKNPQAFVSLGTSVTVTSLGRAPVYLLSVQIIDDRLGVFSESVSAYGEKTPANILISLRYPGDAYYSQPYPCQVLVSTTGGARLVAIPPPPTLTQQDINQLEAAISRHDGDCHNLLDDWFVHHGTYNPRWSVDPAPGETVDHSYEVGITGLHEGELATLVGTHGQPLQIGVAQAGRSLLLSTMVAPAESNEIGVVRGGSIVGVSGIVTEPPTVAVLSKTQQGIDITETLIVRTATVALPDNCQQLSAAYWDGVPVGLAVLKDRLLAFDISNPSLPAVRFSWQISGVRGVLAYRGALLTYGQDGFLFLDSSSALPKVCEGCNQRPVYGLALGSRVIYALTDQGLEVFSSGLRCVSTVEVGPSHTLTRLGNKLVAGGTKGLAIFRLSNPERPKETEFYPMLGLRELVVPPVGQGTPLLAVANPGLSKLLDFGEEGHPKLLAVFPQSPWYVGTARLKSILLRLSPERTAIQVSLFGRSNQL